MESMQSHPMRKESTHNTGKTPQCKSVLLASVRSFKWKLPAQQKPPLEHQQFLWAASVHSLSSKKSARSNRTKPTTRHERRARTSESRMSLNVTLIFHPGAFGQGSCSSFSTMLLFGGVFDLRTACWQWYPFREYLESPITFLTPFQAKEASERKHSFLHMSRNVPFLLAPCQILLRQCPEICFRRPKHVLLRPKGIFKRPHRTCG